MTSVTPIYSDSANFRTWPAETIRMADGNLVTLRLCEELDPESGRWEGFYSIVDEEK
jgi:hypothetical protein